MNSKSIFIIALFSGLIWNQAAFSALPVGTLLPDQVNGAWAPDNNLNGGNGAQAMIGDFIEGMTAFDPGSGTFFPALNSVDSFDDKIHANNGDDQIFGDSTVLDSNLFNAVGNDNIKGNNGDDALFGDAFRMFSAKGGNDTIFGGNGYNALVGDGIGFFLTFAGPPLPSKGGNDTLIGGPRDDWLFGDAEVAGFAFLPPFIQNNEAGQDSLEGGGGNDLMMGDIRPLANAAAIAWGQYTLAAVDTNTFADYITGAEDLFIFDLSESTGDDRILDLNWGGVPDKIVLHNVDNPLDHVSVQDDGGRAKLIFTKANNSGVAGSVVLDTIPYTSGNINDYPDIDITN